MTIHPTKSGCLRMAWSLVALALAVVWQERVWAAEGDAVPAGECAALPKAKRDECFEKRIATLREFVGAKKGPASASPVARAPAPTGSAKPVTLRRQPSPPGKPVSVKPPSQAAKPPAAPAPVAGAQQASDSAPPVGPVYSGPVLTDLEKWATDVITARDIIENKSTVDPAELEQAKLTALRTIGLVLTIASNCKGHQPESGRASCADSEAMSERVLERWVGVKYKRLREELKQLGAPEWHVNVVLALAAEAHADIESLRKRMGDLEKSLVDEKLKVVIRDQVLPAAQKGLPDLQAVLEGLPRLQRAEVMLLVLRAALPGARKRPEAHVVILEAGGGAPLSPVAGDAKRHFLSALKQVLTATTGTDVCDGTLPKRQCKDGARTIDAELHLQFTASAEKLQIAATLQLAGRFQPPGVSAGQKARPVDIALEKSEAACETGEVASRAVTAAWVVMKELEWSFNNNILGDVPHMGIAERHLARPLHDGVQVDELSTTPGAIDHAGAIPLVGSCNSESFVEALKARLAGGFGQRVVEGPSSGGGLQLVVTAAPAALEPLRRDPEVLTGSLEAALPNLTANNWCFAELEQDGRSVYRALVSVRDGTLGSDAGSDLGTYVGARLALSVRADSSADSGAPSVPIIPLEALVSALPRSSELPKTQNASRAYAVWALLSPGLPWLADDTKRWEAFGITAAALDIAVLAGAAFAYKRSADLRNEYAVRPYDGRLLESSDRTRKIGNSFLITAGAMRAVAFLGYLILPPSRGLESQVRVGSHSFSWMF